MGLCEPPPIRPPRRRRALFQEVILFSVFAPLTIKLGSRAIQALGNISNTTEALCGIWCLYSFTQVVLAAHPASPTLRTSPPSCWPLFLTLALAVLGATHTRGRGVTIALVLGGASALLGGGQPSCGRDRRNRSRVHRHHRQCWRRCRFREVVAVEPPLRWRL